MCLDQSENINDFFSFHILSLSEFVQLSFSFVLVAKDILNTIKYAKQRKSSFL